MHSKIVFTAACLLTLSDAISGFPEHDSRDASFTDFTNNIVFTPGANYTSWGAIYARSLQLPDSSLIMTWENYPPEPPHMTLPVYRSTDNGVSWAPYSQIHDTVNGWGLRCQPMLCALPQDFGGYAAGTILASGVSSPQSLSEAFIDLYASTDNGLTWAFVSHISYGAGPETVTNGNDAIWEPFFLMYEGKLVCHYSDQRDSSHVQKLVHVPVDDVADLRYEARPGMTVVAHIESTDRYIMTYEVCGTDNCDAFYRVASSPLEFAAVEGRRVQTNDSAGHTPGPSPYVIWIPHPQRKDGSGLILMNGAHSDYVYINEDSADVDGWKWVDVGQIGGHSRQLSIVDIEGKEKLMLSSGGLMGVSEGTVVSCGIVEIPT
ncbi:hypothetical protein ASPCAL00794 [Aspergillus calidoustus]|uniref:BNR/Asp-box repeat domain protein n=1 Tax=Aspergillus calidoustus TaxID=454130 RepID=A0A0U5FPU0_ASPCI|nr:hypothetical protein ASPCAL00794 [Aspergillus calidoustus]